MSNPSTFDYQIAIVGPTRVGKTSLITALLRETQRLLAGTGVSIGPGDAATEKRINQYKAELRASILAREFNPGSLSGTQEPSIFDLEMKVAQGNTKLRLAILDYPGGWINAEHRPPDRQDDWQKCERWIQDSPVLLVPIDAAVVMESLTQRDLVAAILTLETELTADITRSWVQGRINRRESGLLTLVPVKCESYFNDNGGLRDQSEDLFKKINKLYLPLLESVEEELKGASNLNSEDSSYVPIEIGIQYHPVDTIGSVELKFAQWISSSNSSRLFQAEYLVRGDGDLRPLGADGIMISLCQYILGQEKGKKRGLIDQFWRWATGENRKLVDVLQKLKDQPLSSRTRIIR